MTPQQQNSLLSVEEWLGTFDAEYLDDFILSGGSAVKFLSGDEETLADVRKELSERAISKGYHYVGFQPDELGEDGKKPDFHRMDRFFFRIAETIEWKKEAGKQLVAALAERGVRFPNGQPTSDYQQVAQFNDRDPSDLLTTYQNLVTSLHLRDLGMAVEFRIALTALGRSQLIPDEVTPTTEELLLGWLCGEKAVSGSVPALKKIRIHERIARSNAKFMLQSLCHWLQQIGKSGVVVVFDFRPYEKVRVSRIQRALMDAMELEDAIRRGASSDELNEILDSRNREDPSETYYAPAAYLQALEMLRHFIDEIERLEGFLLVVLGSPSYFQMARSPDSKERRFWDYDALQTRIGLEVHDAERQNPSAGLVHFGRARF